jgi:hypothetical protein
VDGLDLTCLVLSLLENYDAIKESHGDEDMPSREIMALVGQQWAQTSPAEKQMWQFRAEQMKQHTTGIHSQQEHEDELPELRATTTTTEVDMATMGKTRASRKQPTRGVSAVAVTASSAVVLL